MFVVDQIIKGYYVNSNPYGTSDGSLKVYLPELMPMISMGNPRSTPSSLNSSCYCNASDCKPSVSSSINTQNFVTAKAPYTTYELPCYRYGTEIAVQAKADDCLTCRLYPESTDNSILWP